MIQKIIDKFNFVYIDSQEKNSKVAKRFAELFSADKIKYVTEEPFSEVKSELSAQEFDRSKKNLYLTKFKGSFFKRCPGARPGLTCCNYFVLNLGLQCDMNCSYCYLQSFINSPITKIYTNLEQALAELDTLAKANATDSFRIGTGEVIDSLSLDPLTLYSRDLIKFFKKLPNWNLEFKTKSNFVDQFLDLGPARNVTVSWSINPQNIITSEEHGTASLVERLDAAQKCIESGFTASFHIDPIIWHPKWKESYSGLVDTITAKFSPDDFPYMSLGALRFQPEQRHMMRERFGMKSLVTSAELFKSTDGKLRYDHELRKQMFQFVIERFKANNPKWNIFLCMESPETWLSAVKQMPKKNESLQPLFDHNIIRKFNKHKASEVEL